MHFIGPCISFWEGSEHSVVGNKGPFTVVWNATHCKGTYGRGAVRRVKYDEHPFPLPLQSQNWALPTYLLLCNLVWTLQVQILEGFFPWFWCFWSLAERTFCPVGTTVCVLCDPGSCKLQHFPMLPADWGGVTWISGPCRQLPQPKPLFPTLTL